MKLSRTSNLLLQISLSSLLVSHLFAQEYRGRIQGSVLDASDSAIAGATATLVNTGTNIPTTRTSGVAGRYISTSSSRVWS